jgi:hypothetical protein
VNPLPRVLDRMEPPNGTPVAVTDEAGRLRAVGPAGGANPVGTVISFHAPIAAVSSTRAMPPPVHVIG